MENRWSDADAKSAIQRHAEQGIGEDLALRVYTTQLIGGDKRLVLHGGGNTSVKTTLRDTFGDDRSVICVKGSGWDMAHIEAPGLPAMHLAPLRRLRDLEALSDEDMVNAQRTNLLDSRSPNPSVETLLHAFLPHKFIDHSHAVALLSLTDQPDGLDMCREVYGDRVAFIPYIPPGFALAKQAAEIYEKTPEVEGLVLIKHGLFSLGETARIAYDRMIDLVSLAEAHIARGRKRVFVSATPANFATPVEAVAPIIRGALSILDADGAHKRWVLDFRTGLKVRAFVDGKDIERYAQSGVATPDHVIRTKGKPLLIRAAGGGSLNSFAETVRQAVSRYVEAYHAYFTANNARQATPKIELDPMPRVVLVPGLGLFAAGKSASEAAVVGDIAECLIETVTGAEAVGRFESISESDLFDMEYWSLEQAKLGKGKEPPLARQVTLVTGGGGAIGGAVARVFAQAGSAVAVCDLDGAAAKAVADDIGGAALAVTCDVTDPVSIRSTFDAACRRFGGVDIVVSNAGAAWPGAMADMTDELFRKSFEINFFSHHTVAQNAVRIMRAQGTGGALLFNVSKQAVSPGKDFGAYGCPKAALLFLSRQYALEHGADGIRVNAVNADRIRSGLLNGDMIATRSKARGLSEDDYMSGNLLGREVMAEDVAQAFLHQALALKTTGDVTTVDGGNIAAVLR